MDYLNKNNIIKENQYGFREWFNIDHVTFVLPVKVCTKLDNSSQVATIFLDLQKTFDMVKYRLLLYKLDKIGIRRIANK